VLTEALKDRDPEIASAGVSGLAAAGRAAAGEVNRLIGDPVAGPNALKAAGLIADPSSEGPIVLVLPNLEGGLLLDAVDVLGRLGGEASVSPLIGVYSRSDTRLRLAVLKALSGLKISAVAPDLSGFIAGAMADTDDSIRFYSVRAAGSLGAATLVGPLKERLAVESSPLVYNELKRSLDRLETAGSKQ
jgi:HEAT repeat protein